MHSIKIQMSHCITDVSCALYTLTYPRILATQLTRFGFLLMHFRRFYIFARSHTLGLSSRPTDTKAGDSLNGNIVIIFVEIHFRAKPFSSFVHKPSHKNLDRKRSSPASRDKAIRWGQRSRRYEFHFFIRTSNIVFFSPLQISFSSFFCFGWYIDSAEHLIPSIQ